MKKIILILTILLLIILPSCVETKPETFIVGETTPEEERITYSGYLVGLNYITSTSTGILLDSKEQFYVIGKLKLELGNYYDITILNRNYFNKYMPNELIKITKVTP